MFTHSYQTTPCSAYKLDKIELEIRKGMIDGSLVMPESVASVFKESTLTDLYAVTATNDNIPPFAHPVVIAEGDSGYIVLDLRGSTKTDRVGNVTVGARSDLKFLLLRGALQRSWLNLGPADLLSLGSFPVTVYVRWLSENISRRMSLDPASQLVVTVVSGYFYLLSFKEDKSLTENDRIKLASQIARATHIPADKCIDIVATLPVMHNVHDYIAGMIEAVQSVRLAKFNAGLLYSIIGGGWFGANAREVLAVAVEHPPTFLALVYSALNDRSYHRSLFAKTVQAADKNELGKNFTYNLARLPER